MTNKTPRTPLLVRSPRPAFTIVELLVVIGVIGLLMGLLLPALRSVRQNASQTSEMSAARQLMLAYQMYANGNRDRVLPGYWSELPALDASGRRIGVDVLTDIRGPAARVRYPWRIAPYLSYELQALYANENQELLEQYQQDDDYDSYVYGVSLFPSLGLNATWVGGNSQEGAFDPINLQVFGQFYVTTPSQVSHADRLLVFASARGGGDPFDPRTHEGNYRLLSPYLQSEDGNRWSDSFNPGESALRLRIRLASICRAGRQRLYGRARRRHGRRAIQGHAALGQRRQPGGLGPRASDGACAPVNPVAALQAGAGVG